MGIATQAVLALQEGTLLAARSLGGVWRGPRYPSDAFRQMDAVWCGSAAIVLLTGFFTGEATHMIQDFRKNPKKYLTIKLGLF